MSFLTPPSPPDYASMLRMLAGLGSKKYLNISFHYPPGMFPLGASHWIQPIINTADDWLKYADNCWIVWTPQTPKQWQEKFQAVAALKTCYILIMKVDLSPDERGGQQPQWVWDWLAKVR